MEVVRGDAEKDQQKTSANSCLEPCDDSKLPNKRNTMPPASMMRGMGTLLGGDVLGDRIEVGDLVSHCAHQKNGRDQNACNQTYSSLHGVSFCFNGN